MTRQYRAFMLRCWRLGEGDQRFEIAHIQSGESVRATTLADVLAWISARLDVVETSGAGHDEDDAADGKVASDQERLLRRGPQR